MNLTIFQYATSNPRVGLKLDNADASLAISVCVTFRLPTSFQDVCQVRFIFRFIFAYSDGKLRVLQHLFTIAGTNPYSCTLTDPRGGIILNKCYNTLGFQSKYESEYESNLTYVIQGFLLQLRTLATKRQGWKKPRFFGTFFQVFRFFRFLRFYYTQCRIQIYDPRQVAYMKIYVC